MLLSPFTSIKNVVDNAGGHRAIGSMAGKLIKDTFRSIDAIQNVHCPLVIIVGAEDKLVPAKQGWQLHEAAGSTLKRIVEIPGIVPCVHSL